MLQWLSLLTIGFDSGNDLKVLGSEFGVRLLLSGLLPLPQTLLPAYALSLQMNKLNI